MIGKDAIRMTIKFPSEEWVKEWEKRLNASESYAQAACQLGGRQSHRRPAG